MMYGCLPSSTKTPWPKADDPACPMEGGDDAVMIILTKDRKSNRASVHPRHSVIFRRVLPTIKKSETRCRYGLYKHRKSRIQWSKWRSASGNDFTFRSLHKVPSSWYVPFTYFPLLDTYTSSMEGRMSENLCDVSIVSLCPSLFDASYISVSDMFLSFIKWCLRRYSLVVIRQDILIRFPFSFLWPATSPEVCLQHIQESEEGFFFRQHPSRDPGHPSSVRIRRYYSSFLQEFVVS